MFETYPPEADCVLSDKIISEHKKTSRVGGLSCGFMDLFRYAKRPPERGSIIVMIIKLRCIVLS